MQNIEQKRRYRCGLFLLLLALVDSMQRAAVAGTPICVWLPVYGHDRQPWFNIATPSSTTTYGSIGTSSISSPAKVIIGNQVATSIRACLFQRSNAIKLTSATSAGASTEFILHGGSCAEILAAKVSWQPACDSPGGCHTYDMQYYCTGDPPSKVHATVDVWSTGWFATPKRPSNGINAPAPYIHVPANSIGRSVIFQKELPAAAKICLTSISAISLNVSNSFDGSGPTSFSKSDARGCTIISGRSVWIGSDNMPATNDVNGNYVLQ